MITVKIFVCQVNENRSETSKKTRRKRVHKQILCTNCINFINISRILQKLHEYCTYCMILHHIAHIAFIVEYCIISQKLHFSLQRLSHILHRVINPSNFNNVTEQCQKNQNMSLYNLARFGNFSKNNISYGLLSLRQFSRKSNNKGGSYKTVPRRATKESNNNAKLISAVDPSIDLLAPSNGFPFFLPGNVGIGWYDTLTSLRVTQDFVMEQINDETKIDGDIICRVQSCPTVLRKTVCQLFPYRNLETCELSVVTISLKPNLKLLRKNLEIETERLAQTFVLTAKIVCDKLRNNGYWADFVNPFSGRPYLYPSFNKTLYEADEKFRCLDFQIFDIETCKIVSNEEDKSKRRFNGSLFTNAPSKRDHLNNIFTKS